MGSREKHRLCEGRGRDSKIGVIVEEMRIRVRVDQEAISPAHDVHETGLGCTIPIEITGPAKLPKHRHIVQASSGIRVGKVRGACRGIDG